MPGYSGNLVRTYAQSNDVRSGFTPDKAHQGGTHADRDATAAYRTARQVPENTGAEYEGSAFPVDVTVSGGLVLDTPKFTGPDAHEGPGWYGPVYSDDQARELFALEHRGEGEGAALRSAWEPPAYQGRYEHYSDQLEQGFLIAEKPNVDALTRGINAYPANNPDRPGYVRGVRPGLHRRYTSFLLRMQHRRRWEYDAQPLAMRDFLVPVNTDPGAAPSPGPVLPGWLPLRIGHRETRPQLWRRPEELDADQLAEDVTITADVIGGDVA